MTKQHIAFDKNAHIANLTSNVEIVQNRAIAFVSFKSLCKSAITAVKLNAKGYNSFGDVVCVNGKENFLIIIQDISILPNSVADKLKVILPSNDIKKLDIEESQICLADGSVCTYEGNSIVEYDIDIITDSEKLNAIRDYEPAAVNMPLQLDGDWVCLCGRYNDSKINLCEQCNKEKAQTFSVVTDDSVATLIENRKKRLADEEVTTKKARKKRNIQIGIGAIIGITLLILIIYGAIMAGRTTYKTESEMKTALQGTWTYYNDSGTAMRQIIISGDTLKIKYKYVDSDMENTIKWNPSQGTFKTFQTYVVKSNGTIKQGGDIYKKGGYMSTSTNSDSTNSYESGYSVLKITVDNVTNNSSYAVCTGSVKNTGNKTYKFIQVKGSFKDASGNVIDTDWTYAAGSEGLASGESTTFRLSVPKNYKISSCSVSLLDFK